MFSKGRQYVDVFHKVINLRGRIIKVPHLTPKKKSPKIKAPEIPKIETKPIDNGPYTWEYLNRLPENDTPNIPNWVSATRIKNYMHKDEVIDWLELYSKKLGFNEFPQITQSLPFSSTVTFANPSNNTNIFCEMGLKFEEIVIGHLRAKYPNQIKKVVTSNNVTFEHNAITLKYMLEGTPIIEQGALYNTTNMTFGVADLLIRSDYVNELFTQQILTSEQTKIKAPILKGLYHYIVIDIKWTTMHLCANGLNIRNFDRFPAHKGQLTIYNSALGNLQGYTPQCAYILAKGWFIDSTNNKESGNNCFDRLGVIDYNGFDNKYIKATYEGVCWIRNVRSNGSKWSCLPKPSVPELYPNMCNRYDGSFHQIKKTLAKELGELTMVHRVGPKNRKIAQSLGINSWKDPKCSAKTLGIKGKKIAPLVDKILYINRDSPTPIEPQIISNNDSNWRTETVLDFYVDFETLTETLYNNINILDSRANNPFLFMIGVGYIYNGTWQYSSFTATDVTLKEEFRIMDEFTKFIANITQRCNIKLKPKLFHWSCAEKATVATLNRRHKQKWLSDVMWCDLYKLFIEEPIVIKGAMSFSLKEIAKAMKEHGMIETNWLDNGIGNGLEAMLEAIQYYKSPKEDNIIMMNITNYNEADCKVLWEILHHLRTYH